MVKTLNEPRVMCTCSFFKAADQVYHMVDPYS